MKKFLTIAVAAVFVLTLAATTYAVELKASGYLRTRTQLNVNASRDPYAIKDPTDTMNETYSRMHNRARLKFKLKADENLEGVVYFETDDIYGDLKPDDGKDQGIPVGADRIDFEVKQAYLSFKVPGLDAYPTRALFGINPTGLGFGNISKEGAGIRTETKIGTAKLILQYYKALENNALDTYTKADDVDHYCFRVSMPFGDLTPAVHGNWMHNGRGSIKTVGQTAVSAASSLYWLGFSLGGKIGPAKVQGDFTYNGGTVDYRYPVAGVDEDEYGGYVFRVKASIPVDRFEVGAEFFYGSGDDVDDIPKGEISGWREVKDAAGYQEQMVYYAGQVSEYAGLADHMGPDVGSGEPTGDWMLRVFASTKPLDWMKLTLMGAYMGDNVDNGDRFGTARKADGVTLEDNSDAGFEIAVMAEMAVYKQLKFEVGAGYLFAGDALDQWDAVKGKNVTPDDPWILVTELKYSF